MDALALTRTLAALALLATPAGLGACFESGPLGSGEADGPTDAFVLPESVEPDDGEAGVPDTAVPDVTGSTDTKPADVPPELPTGTPCLTDVDCKAEVVANRCKGPVRCLDYVCVQDESEPVACEAPSDPCMKATCVPETGACENEPTCVCKPLAAGLKCGAKIKMSTADAGATASMKGYACGPETGETAEHTWLFEVKQPGPTKITVTANKLSGVYVVGWDGKNCERTACVAGGTKAVAWNAQAGETYAIVVEHAPGAPVALQLDVLCNVAGELDCGDGLDDDGNGLTDCEDAACFGLGGCASATETACDNEVDEDEDGMTDCADPDCDASAACKQTCSFTPAFKLTCSLKSYQWDVKSDSPMEVSQYVCGGTQSVAAGREEVFLWNDTLVPAGTLVTMQLETTSLLSLYVMKDQPGGATECNPKHCVGGGGKSASFFYNPNESYFIAVEAVNGIPLPADYKLTWTCQ